MGKSLGNAWTVTDICKKGFDPLALRYFYLTGHYRKQLNFTWEALTAAGTALDKMRSAFYAAKNEKGRTILSVEKNDKERIFAEKFRACLSNDLDMPGAMATTWEVIKSNIPGGDKAELLTEFDQVLGLNLTAWKPKELPVEVKELLAKRDELRKAKNWAEADKLRQEIETMGYRVEDPSTGSGSI